MSQSYQPKPAPPQSVTPKTDAAVPTPRPQGGRPLPAAVLQEMEARFGVSFGAVRVIEGSSLARDAGMDGVAAGLEVHLADTLDGASDEGRHLLAHELAHVVQQGLTEAPADAPLLDDSGLEAEADAVADRVIRGEPAAVVGRAPHAAVQTGKRKTAAAQFLGISSQTVSGHAGGEKAREGELAAILATPHERAWHIADLLDTRFPKMPTGRIGRRVGEFVEKRFKNASTFHSLMFWLTGPTEGLHEAYAHVSGGRTLFADLSAAFPTKRAQGRYLADLARTGMPSVGSRISMALGLVTGAPPAPEEALRLFEEASPAEREQVMLSPWWDELQKVLGKRKWKHFYRRLPIISAPSGNQRTGARVKRLRAAGEVAKLSTPKTLSLGTLPPEQRAAEERKEADRKDARRAALVEQAVQIVKQYNGITGLKRKALATELQKWASRLDPADRWAVARDPAFNEELERMPVLPNSLRRQSNVKYLRQLVWGGEGDLTDKASEVLAYIERKAERPWHPLKRFENFDGIRQRVDALSPAERDAILRHLVKDRRGTVGQGKDVDTQGREEGAEHEGAVAPVQPASTESETDMPEGISDDGYETSAEDKEASDGSTEAQAPEGAQDPDDAAELDEAPEPAGSADTDTSSLPRWRDKGKEKVEEEEPSDDDDDAAIEGSSHAYLARMRASEADHSPAPILDSEAVPSPASGPGSQADDSLPSEQETLDKERRELLRKKLERAGMRGTELEHQMAQFEPGAAGSSSKGSIPAKLRELAYSWRKHRGFGATAVELVSQLRGAELLEVRSDAKLIAELKRRSGRDARVRIEELLGGGATPVVVRRETEKEQQQKAADDAELRPEHWAVKLDLELSKKRRAWSRTRVYEIILRAHAAAKRLSPNPKVQDRFGHVILDHPLLTPRAKSALSTKRLAGARKALEHLSTPPSGEECLRAARYRRFSPKRARSHGSNGKAILAMARAADRETLLATWSNARESGVLIPDVKDWLRRELKRLPRGERVSTLAALRKMIADALEQELGPHQVGIRALRTLADLDQRRLDDTGKQYNHFLLTRKGGRLPLLGHWGATATSALRKEASSMEVGAMRMLLAKLEAGTLTADDFARFDAIHDEYGKRAAVFRQVRDEANRFSSLLVKMALAAAGAGVGLGLNAIGAPVLVAGGAAFMTFVLRQAIATIVQRALEGHRFQRGAAITEATTQILVAGAVSVVDVGLVPAIAELAGLAILAEEGVPRAAVEAGLRGVARTTAVAERVATGRRERRDLPNELRVAALRVAGTIAVAFGSDIGAVETKGDVTTTIDLGVAEPEADLSTAIGQVDTLYGIASGTAFDKLEEKLRSNQEIAKDLKPDNVSDDVSDDESAIFDEVDDEIDDDASRDSGNMVHGMALPGLNVGALREEEEVEDDDMTEIDVYEDEEEEEDEVTELEVQPSSKEETSGE